MMRRRYAWVLLAVLAWAVPCHALAQNIAVTETTSALRQMEGQLNVAVDTGWTSNAARAVSAESDGTVRPRVQTALTLGSNVSRAWTQAGAGIEAFIQNNRRSSANFLIEGGYAYEQTLVVGADVFYKSRYGLQSRSRDYDRVGINGRLGYDAQDLARVTWTTHLEEFKTAVFGVQQNYRLQRNDLDTVIPIDDTLQVSADIRRSFKEFFQHIVQRVGLNRLGTSERLREDLAHSLDLRLDAVDDISWYTNVGVQNSASNSQGLSFWRGTLGGGVDLFISADIYLLADLQLQLKRYRDPTLATEVEEVRLRLSGEEEDNINSVQIRVGMLATEDIDLYVHLSRLSNEFAQTQDYQEIMALIGVSYSVSTTLLQP